MRSRGASATIPGVSRDPFRPQDPWSAEWLSERRLPETPKGVTPGVALLWVVCLLLLAGLYLVLPIQAFGIVAVVVLLVLLSTLRV